MDDELYQVIGGTEKCRKLSEAFYARVTDDPLLRPFFPGKNRRCAIEQFSAFLAQLLGGPTEDMQLRWWLSLRESHARFRIGAAERDAWMKRMLQALDDVSMEEPARSALTHFFEQSSAYMVNAGDAPVATEAPTPNDVDRDIAKRWTAQRTLDEAVTAVRERAAGRAILLAEGAAMQAYCTRNRSVLAALLATMIDSADADMLEYVRRKLVEDPSLAVERYSGRTLLHGAAGAGNAEVVQLLLSLGAHPDTPDTGGHTPLYSVANECNRPGGAGTVHALVEAGANVDACEGVKRCTPLHMAARRDHLDVAEALLDCGANIEARDSLGETPLRRAVNCNQTQVAALLVEKGADIHSKGSKNLTPVQAARTAAIRRIFETLHRA